MRYLLLFLLLSGCSTDVWYSKEYCIYRDAYDRGWYDKEMYKEYLFNSTGNEKLETEKLLNLLKQYNKKLK